MRVAAILLLVATSCSSDKPQAADAKIVADGSVASDAKASDAARIDGAVTSDAHPIDATTGTTVSFQADVVPLVSNCYGEGCHGLLGTTTWPYATLVNQPTDECSDNRVLVKPGDATNSYLLQKLKGIDMCSGVRMPKFGAALADSDLQTIADWISQGALNN